MKRSTDLADVRLDVWRQFKLGDKVIPTCNYQRGRAGKVVELLEERIDGLSRVAVKFERNFEEPRDFIADFRRCELKRAKTGPAWRRRPA